MELAKVYRANVFKFRLLALFLSRELWELHGLVCHYLLSLLSIVQVTWRKSTRLLGMPLKPKKLSYLVSVSGFLPEVPPGRSRQRQPRRGRRTSGGPLLSRHRKIGNLLSRRFVSRSRESFFPVLCTSSLFWFRQDFQFASSEASPCGI